MNSAQHFQQRCSLFVLAGLLSGCGSLLPAPTVTSTSTTTATSSPSPTATVTATDTPAPTHTATIPPTPSPYDGAWAGQSADGLALSFSVQYAIIANTSVNCRFLSNGVSAVINFNPPGLTGPIVDGKFSLSTLAITFAGVFHSSTSASGTLEFPKELCQSTRTTWSASKKP